MRNVEKLANLIVSASRPSKSDMLSTGTVRRETKTVGGKTYNLAKVEVNGVSHTLNPTNDYDYRDGDQVRITYDDWGRAVVMGK